MAMPYANKMFWTKRRVVESSAASESASSAASESASSDARSESLGSRTTTDGEHSDFENVDTPTDDTRDTDDTDDSDDSAPGTNSSASSNASSLTAKTASSSGSGPILERVALVHVVLVSDGEFPETIDAIGTASRFRDTSWDTVTVDPTDLPPDLESLYGLVPALRPHAPRAVRLGKRPRLPCLRLWTEDATPVRLVAVYTIYVDMS